jgi:outer membrane protein, multidrug efflux system
MRNYLPGIALPTLLAAILTACAGSQTALRPAVEVPAQFAGLDSVPAAARTDASQDGAIGDTAEFWQGLNDPILSRLVDRALLSNHDLRIAIARYDSANALLRSARFDRWPTLTASASASDARASQDQAPGVSREDRDGKSYDAGINARWELDLFGRVRKNVEARRADADALAADFQAVQVVIVSEVVRDYVSLRGLQEQRRVAQENADSQAETLRLVEMGFQAGRGTEFDTARARAQLSTTQSRVPAIDAQIGIAMHHLSVLVGQPPEALTGELQWVQPLPALPARIDPGTPGDLLRRRPDVAAAEQRLHAATARVGVAAADLFPRFTLGGLIGTQAIERGALFERGSETRLVALGIDWSFLDVGRVRARIAAANADAAGELATYEKTVLIALEDTENALVRYGQARIEDEHLLLAATDSARAAKLARVRYDAGASDLFEVLDAERTNLQAQDALAQSRTRTLVGLVSVYQAMAGGWPARQPADAQARLSQAATSAR